MYFRVYQALYVRPFTSYEEVPRTTHSTAVWSAVVTGSSHSATRPTSLACYLLLMKKPMLQVRCCFWWLLVGLAEDEGTRVLSRSGARVAFLGRQS